MRKPVVFKIILILSPILLLLFIEGALRLFNYAGPRALVIERVVDGKNVYALNDKVTRNYFTQKDLRQAVYTEQTFAKEKTANTYRIFCLGESTTYGYPYPPNVNFPVFLQQRLQTLFPERRFEIINVGMTAISSFAVADFVNELVDYQPDLFLLYMGHNEFYGAQGSASSENFSHSFKLLKWHLALQRNCRLYALLRDALTGLAGFFQGGESKEGQILMQRMVGKQGITIASTEHQYAIQNFIDNLLEIIDTARRHQVKLLVSTLVCNLKDQPPFETVLMPAPKQETWKNYLEQGDAHRERGDSLRAAFLYGRASEVFPESADTQFILGRRYLGIENAAKAREHLETALDLDLMPFRARTEFNRALLAVCADKGVPVVPMDEIFNLNSRHGIPGNEVFTEHVHPNHLGYFLMAKRFCLSMYEQGCIAPSRSWNLARSLSDEAYWEMAGITPLDLRIGEMRVEIMKKCWPFTTEQLPDAKRMPKLATAIDTITYYHVGDRLDWPSAHIEVGNYLLSKGQAGAAEKEFQVVLRHTPGHLNAQLGLAGVCFQQERLQEAEAILKEAEQQHAESPYPPARLGVLYLSMQNHQAAIGLLEKALNLHAAGQTLAAKDLLETKYNLAAAYALNGERQRPKQLLRDILEQNPEFAQAQQLFNRL